MSEHSDAILAALFNCHVYTCTLSYKLKISDLVLVSHCATFSVLLVYHTSVQSRSKCHASLADCHYVMEGQILVFYHVILSAHSIKFCSHY